MELVAEKYKQTEVGLIPNDWSVFNLTQLIEKTNGINIGPFGATRNSL